jgi:hypothetical protein
VSCHHKDRLHRVEPLFKSETSFSFGCRIIHEKFPWLPCLPPSSHCSPTCSFHCERPKRSNPFHSSLYRPCGATLCFFPTSARTRVRLFPHLASERDREIAAVDSVCEGKMIVHGSWRRSTRRKRTDGQVEQQCGFDVKIDLASGEAEPFGSDPTHQKAFSPTSRVINEATRPQSRLPPCLPHTLRLFPRVSRTLPFLLSSCSLVPSTFCFQAIHEGRRSA